MPIVVRVPGFEENARTTGISSDVSTRSVIRFNALVFVGDVLVVACTHVPRPIRQGNGELIKCVRVVRNTTVLTSVRSWVGLSPDESSVVVRVPGFEENARTTGISSDDKYPQRHQI